MTATQSVRRTLQEFVNPRLPVVCFLLPILPACHTILARFPVCCGGAARWQEYAETGAAP